MPRKDKSRKARQRDAMIASHKKRMGKSQQAPIRVSPSMFIQLMEEGKVQSSRFVKNGLGASDLGYYRVVLKADAKINVPNANGIKIPKDLAGTKVRVRSER